MNWASSLAFGTYHMCVTKQTFHIFNLLFFCQNIAMIHIKDKERTTRLKTKRAVLQGCVTILFV